LSDSKVYDPFGEVAAINGVSQITVGFQGDYTDPTSGEVWMGARWYDPTGAQFRSRDTVFGELMTPLSLNRYTYGFANPLVFWDPDGRYVQGPLIDGQVRNRQAANKQRAVNVRGRNLRAAKARRLNRLTSERLDNPTYRPTQAGQGARDTVFIVEGRDYHAVESISLAEGLMRQDTSLVLCTIYGCHIQDPGAGLDVGESIWVALEVLAFTDIGDVWTTLTGRDTHGQQVGLVDRGLAAAGIFIPLVGGKAPKVGAEALQALFRSPADEIVSRSADDLVNLASPDRTRHILDGEVRPDGSFGGGHRAGTGSSNRTEFPADWSDAEIMHHVSDVATDPLSAARPGDRLGDYFAVGVRDGVEIEVLICNGEIWTAYPTRP
jgi:RHS repeat-associated protein